MTHKKQAFELIEGICKLNEVVWGYPRGSYDDATESAYPIEEALEGFDLYDLQNSIRSDFNGETSAKEWSRLIINSCSLPESGALQVPINIPDVDRFDKHLDQLYFAIGSLHKLGLTPEHIVEGLQVVHTANEMKGNNKDSQGKITKPADWESLYAPEPKLQAILDRRP
jgi:hypothetical protein